MNDLMNPITSWNPTKNHMSLLYDERANKQFTYSSIEKLMENTSDLMDMIQEHKTYQVPRLKILKYYYLNKNIGIMTRPLRQNPEKSDVRLSHAFAKYIVDFNVGYDVGIPVNVEYNDDDINVALKSFQEDNDVDALNTDLKTTLSKYGRSYEIQYRDKDNVDRIKELSSFNTFIVYDKTIERNELFGIYYIEDDGEFTIEMHTSEDVIYFEETEKSTKDLKISKEEPHDRGELDIIEWANDREHMGDYELVINQIDGYDSSQSNLTNFLNDTNEAKLLVTGNISDSMMNADPKDVAIGNRESDMIIIKAEIEDGTGKMGTVDVKYMQREYQVEGSESARNQLIHDIHKFSYTPNFNDEFFSNETSGVAIENKMFNSSHRALMKQKLFEKGLRKRYRMWAHFKKTQDELTGYNPRELSIKQHLNMRTSFQDELKALIEAGMEISQKTLRELAPFIQDADAESKRIEEEKELLKNEPNSSTSHVVDPPTP